MEKSTSVEVKKLCKRCGESKSLSEFFKSKTFSDGRGYYCKSCCSDAKRMHYYKITPERYSELLTEQNDACAICLTPTSDLRIPLAVDHDHACCPGRMSCGECIRGLICDSCNRGLGYLGDSYERAVSAVRYLERYGKRTAPSRPRGRSDVSRGRTRP